MILYDLDLLSQVIELVILRTTIVDVCKIIVLFKKMMITFKSFYVTYKKLILIGQCLS